MDNDCFQNVINYNILLIFYNDCSTLRKEFGDMSWAPTTSNLAERLFSQARYFVNQIAKNAAHASRVPIISNDQRTLFQQKSE